MCQYYCYTPFLDPLFIRSVYQNDKRHDKGIFNIRLWWAFFPRHGAKKKCSLSQQSTSFFHLLSCSEVSVFLLLENCQLCFPIPVGKECFCIFFLQSFDFNYNSIAVTCIQQNAHFFIALDKTFRHWILFTSLFNLSYIGSIYLCKYT